MPHPTLYVLRHGETDWNVEGRLQGAFDSPLTDTGRAQAHHQGRILHHHDIRAPIFCSPQGRAVATARIIAAHLNTGIIEDSALREVTMGAWDGQLVADVAPAAPQDDVLWKFTAPGGETLAKMQRRLRLFVRQLDAPAILVTHGVTSRVLRALVLGLPDDQIAALPGGQGVVFQLSEGTHRKLDTGSCT